MVTNARELMSINGGFLTVETFYGLSTDDKPTNTANGSKFIEMDTGLEFLYDFAGQTWYQFPPAAEAADDTEPADDDPPADDEG